MSPIPTASSASGRSATAVRLAAGGYFGVCLGTLAALLSLLLFSSPSTPALLGSSFVALAGGTGVGIALARRLDLSVRIGRSRRRRLALLAPAGAIAAAFLVSTFATVGGGRFRTVALASLIAITVAGYALSRLAGNRYVDAITPAEPRAAYRWRPPASPRVDPLVTGLALLGTVGYAVAGNPIHALWWASFVLLWLGGAVLEGRWPARLRNACELRVYDTGFVKKRPYARSFVSWDDVGHVRLRDGELVFDRGPLDVSFGRDELEDPEAVLAAVERAYSGVVVR